MCSNLVTPTEGNIICVHESFIESFVFFEIDFESNRNEWILVIEIEIEANSNRICAPQILFDFDSISISIFDIDDQNPFDSISISINFD